MGTEMENFIKTHLQMSTTTEHLRKVFCQKWIELRNEKWENSEENGSQLNSLMCKRIRNFQREHLKSADLSRWDFSILVEAIKSLVKIQSQATEENEMLDMLVSVRNKLAHMPGASISDTDCKEMCAVIEAALKFYGFSDTDLKNVKETSNVTLKKSTDVSFNENNTKKAEKLMQEAKEYLTQGEAKKAINKMSEGLLISGLKKSDVSLLYATRAEGYLLCAPPEIEKSLEDCTEAVTISPTCARSYFQLAHAHEATENLEKALKNYEIAFGLDPLNNTIKVHRENAKFKNELQKYMLEVKLLRDSDDVVSGFIHSKGMEKSKENMEKYRSQLLQGTGPMTFILKAHNFREAMKYNDAAEFYEKVIEKYPEAVLNLAVLKIFGRGTKQSFSEGLGLIKKTATHPLLKRNKGSRSEPNYGVPEAGFILGLYYEEAKRDYMEALKTYGRACENTEYACGIAGYRIGAILYNGKGVPVCKKFALDQWKASATNPSHGYNILSLESLVKHYIEDEKDFAKAFIWYKTAKERGSTRLPDNEDEFRTRLEELGTIQLHIELPELELKIEGGSKKTVAKLMEAMHVQLNQGIRAVISDYFSRIGTIMQDEEVLQFTTMNPKPKINSKVESMYPVEQTKRFKQMAKRGNVYAERLLKTQAHYLSAIHIFQSADVLDESSSVKFIQDYANAIQLESHFIALPEEQKPKLLEFLNNEFASLTSSGDNKDKKKCELEKDTRICLAYQLLHSGPDYDALLTFLKQSSVKFPKEEHFYMTLCQVHMFKKETEMAVKEANRGLEHFPTSHSLLYCKALAQSNLEYLTTETIINDYLEYLNYAPKGDRALPQVCYGLTILYNRVRKQEIEAGGDGKNAYILSKEYFNKARQCEKSVPDKLPDIAVKHEAESLFANHTMQRAVQFSQSEN